jgi:hypothetical protein
MAGHVVVTSSGKKGRTDNKEKTQIVHGIEKVFVILDESEKKVLCDPKGLSIVGYWD